VVNPLELAALAEDALPGAGKVGADLLAESGLVLKGMAAFTQVVLDTTGTDIRAVARQAILYTRRCCVLPAELL
jgi:hypothetical protein